MKRLLIWLVAPLLFYQPRLADAQGNDVGIMGGASNYSGDLQPSNYTFFESHPAFSFMYWRELNGHVNLRTGISFGQISADDRYNPKLSTRIRNLSFHSNITEIQFGVEYHFINMYTHRFSPYIFAGLAIFHFNPTTVDTNGRRVALQPLSTEGEGLAAYPGQHPYNLIQVDIPLGGGLSYAATSNLTVGIEIGLRKTFTDYLDDASTIYVDKTALLAAKGPEAVELAFRTNELPGYQATPYPAAGTPRASSRYKDFYYFTQLSIAYRLPEGKNHSHITTATGLEGAERAVRCPPNAKKK
ncbi:MAG TPA: DUF6089 family protein [Chitinophagaceae bacterium]|nr:DUF6089 family protein [Chitinophagaceae bacterium]